MLRNLATLFLSFIAFAAQAGPLRLNLKTAMDNHLVSVTGEATSQGYRGKGLRLKVTNKSGSQLMLTMDQGLIFSPAEEGQQDLVLAGGEANLFVQPFKDATFDLQTFCAEASDAAPTAGMAYTFSEKGDTQLVQVLQYLKRFYMFDALGQSAVWVVTDDYNPATAYDAGRDAQARKLVTFLEGVTGRKADRYFTQYAQNTTPGQPVVSDKPLKIVAQFEQLLDAPKKLTLGVFDEKGAMIQKVFQDQIFGRAGHRFKVEFQSAAVPGGRYYIRLKEGDAVLQETAVKVD
jgi:hypothetical protein